MLNYFKCGRMPRFRSLSLLLSLFLSLSLSLCLSLLSDVWARSVLRASWCWAELYPCWLTWGAAVCSQIRLYVFVFTPLAMGSKHTALPPQTCDVMVRTCVWVTGRECVLSYSRCKTRNRWASQSVIQFLVSRREFSSSSAQKLPSWEGS